MLTYDGSVATIYKNGSYVTEQTINNSRSLDTPKFGNDAWNQDLEAYMTQPAFWEGIGDESMAATLYNSGNGLPYTSW